MPRLPWVSIAATFFVAVAPVCGAEGAAKNPLRDSQNLAGKIDDLIAKRWAEAKAQPAPRADDAEFLRRVYLDMAGRIPTVAESRAFLDDTRSDKRAQLVEQLLADPRYVANFTNFWRALLIPEAGNNFQVRLQQGAFEEWLKKQVAKNAGYDQLVRDLLTAKVGTEGGGFNINAILGGNSGPVTYYLAKEFKPENLAAGAARIFLGVSVECAQCHNHPFAEWKRDQFWSFAAFFSGIQSQRLMDFLLPGQEDVAKHEIAIPGTDKTVAARFLDGTEPKWGEKPAARPTLAEWITAPTNPYFARTAVNRAWAYLYGTGLVEPVDDMGANPSHPEVLDLLAREFAAHQFDLKFLFRTLTATRIYQLSSIATNTSQDEPALFARMPLRGLTAEKIFDSVATATGYRDSGGGDDLISGLVGGNRSARSDFLTKFARSERPVQGIGFHSASAHADEWQGDSERHLAVAQRNAGRGCRCAVPQQCRAHRDTLSGDAVAQAVGERSRPNGEILGRGREERQGSRRGARRRAGRRILGVAEQS